MCVFNTLLPSHSPRTNLLKRKDTSFSVVKIFGRERERKKRCHFLGKQVTLEIKMHFHRSSNIYVRTTRIYVETYRMRYYYYEIGKKREKERKEYRIARTRARELDLRLADWPFSSSSSSSTSSSWSSPPSCRVYSSDFPFSFLSFF